MADVLHGATFEDMEAFFRQAKYPLVKHTDMNMEMKEEAMDICITAVEKYPADLEKCTQARGAAWPLAAGA
jgi:dynein light chain 4